MAQGSVSLGPVLFGAAVHEPREYRNVWAVTSMTVLFAAAILIIRESPALMARITGVVPQSAVTFGTTALSAYLLGLLAVTYIQWKKTAVRHRDLETILASISPDTLIVVDPQRTVLMCNPSVTRMFGYRPEEVLGRKTDLLYGDRRGPDRRYHEIYDSVEGAGYHVGMATGRRKNGETFELEIITGKMRVEGGAVLLLRDINDRIAAENAARESSRRYAGIVNNALVGIFQTLPGGKFVTANTSLAWLFGYPGAPDLIASVSSFGRDLFSVPSAAQELERQMSVNGTVNRHEAKLKRKDGSEFWGTISARSVRDAYGTLVYYEGVIEDISAQKKAEEAMRTSLGRLRRASGSIIDALTAAVEARDPYTSGHQRRVADLARAIGTEMGLPADQVDGLRIAGIIHDLGKITLPAEILTSPRKLTEIEFNLIKAHPRTGYDLIKDIDFPWPVAEAVLQHHERLDGSGYPGGLKGGAILPEARILAVADVVEAIASHRPYRPALGIDRALDEILKGRGTHFDEDVVEACIRLFREKGYRIQESTDRAGGEAVKDDPWAVDEEFFGPGTSAVLGTSDVLRTSGTKASGTKANAQIAELEEILWSRKGGRGN